MNNEIVIPLHSFRKRKHNDIHKILLNSMTITKFIILIPLVSLFDIKLEGGGFCFNCLIIKFNIEYLDLHINKFISTLKFKFSFYEQNIYMMKYAVNSLWDFWSCTMMKCECFVNQALTQLSTQLCCFFCDFFDCFEFSSFQLLRIFKKLIHSHLLQKWHFKNQYNPIFF